MPPLIASNVLGPGGPSIVGQASQGAKAGSGYQIGLKVQGIAEQTAQELQRGVLVTALLHHDVEYFALVINGSPQIRLRATNLHDDLIETPATSW